MTYRPHTFQKQFHKSSARFRTLIAGRRGGKAQPISEPVLTPDGFVMIGDIAVGDYVIGADGRQTRVLGVYPQGESDIYRLVFSDGAETRATADHLWDVRFTNAHNKKGIYTTGQLINHIEEEYPKGRRCKRIQVRVPDPVHFSNCPELPLDPYLLGLILGDGGISQDTVVITTAEQEIVDYLNENWEVVRTGDKYGYRIISGIDTDPATGRFISRPDSIKSKLSRLGLMGKNSHTKFIPDIYLTASVEDRISILQGLMDTDGYIDSRGHAMFYSVNRFLAVGVQWLVRSLGGTATLSDKKTAYNGGEVASYSVYIQFSGDIVPVRVGWKVERWKPLGVGKLHRRILSIEKVGREDAVCIEVEAEDSLYVTKNFIVTHNTIAGTIESLQHAYSNPGSLGYVVAPTYVMLNDVNIPMLFEWLPTSVIESFHKVEKRLVLKNGSEIRFRSGDNEDSLRGPGIDWLWLDEACFMDSYVWDVLLPALTDKRGVAWVTTTPQGYDWVYNKFYRPAVEGNEDYKVWTYRTIDNPYIDAQLVEEARRDMSEQMFRQEYLATFEKFSGLVYPDFDEKTMTFEHDEDEIEAPLYFIGIDVGYTNPTAIVLIAEDVKHRLWVIDEWYQSNKTAPEIAQAAREVAGTRKIENYIIDPASRGTQQTSEMSIFDQLIENGLPLVPGNNDVRGGINRMTQIIRRKGLRVHRRCVNFIQEMNTYSWKEGKRDESNTDERPHKKGDHLMDATRYIAMARPDWYERPTLDQYGREVRPIGEKDMMSEGSDYDII